MQKKIDLIKEVTNQKLCFNGHSFSKIHLCSCIRGVRHSLMW